MKLSRDIDLGRSLRQVFGNDADSEEQVEHDRARQTAAGNAILQRFFGRKVADRRELTVLADEVGLGKTYVALAVAVSILDAIRRGEAPEGLPANRPAVLILTPTNDALFNKWMREAESFRQDCARTEGALDWLQIASPLDGSSKSGNIADLTRRLAEATRSQPLLLIAKEGSLGAALGDRDWWRRRALAVVFEKFRVSTDDRPGWCRAILGSGSRQYVPELLDLRKSNELWQHGADVSTDLYRAFQRALREGSCAERIEKLLGQRKVAGLVDAIDDLTRSALAGDWPLLPLVIVDEIHGFKNPYVQARRHFERLLSGRVVRFLGLSATPFQLRQDELLSILKLRNILSLPNGRHNALTDAVEKLAGAMKVSREAGEIFRKRWLALRPVDNEPVAEAWKMLAEAPESERETLLGQLRPPRLKHALAAALALAQGNQQLRLHLRPFVIRHLHPRGYREHFVGKDADQRAGHGSPNFDWAPGLEVSGNDELTHYLMMRAVALSKDEKGLPGLGAELTGSYRHLVETAAVWKKLENATNPLLREYRAILQKMIGHRTGRRDPDAEHRKIQSTVRRTVEFFKKGQKTLIFCVYTKTAESIRDQLLTAVEKHLAIERDRVFGDASTFENFRRRFFNRREPLFSLIQDHPLLGPLGTPDAVGVPKTIALAEDALREIAQILVDAGESPETDKPDRRLLLAATEHVALLRWKSSADGRDWLFGKQGVLRHCLDLADLVSDKAWLEAREPLSRSERATRTMRAHDPEARAGSRDPLDAELADERTAENAGRNDPHSAVQTWVRRLSKDAIGEVIAPYFKPGVIVAVPHGLPLLARHHATLLAELDLQTRAMAGQVFRRILMAEEFLLRYLADVEKENTERWSNYLSDRYVNQLEGHLESLRDRVEAYFETLVRGRRNKALLAGYHSAAENRNVVQLVKGGMDRDRYFLGFNTPYRPEILVSTQVGQEGIDLHRECRHVIHHDLCWNPATIEQRTGRVDRIGSKVERERLSAGAGSAATLEIAVPYLAATYDERMFEELYRRAQLFEVTLGGDMRVDGRAEAENVEFERRRRETLGIGTEDEDLGEEGGATDSINLPEDMVERLRVDLSVWRVDHEMNE